MSILKEILSYEEGVFLKKGMIVRALVSSAHLSATHVLESER